MTDDAAPSKRETSRESLRRVLRNGPFTAHELSAAAGVPERDVAEHLSHVERTAKAHGEVLDVEPARCEGCGFVFAKRERLGRPSRCPKCRNGHILPPRFTLRER